VILGATGAGGAVIFAFVLAWVAAAVLVAVRMIRRSPMVVVKVRAEGTNQVMRMIVSRDMLGN